MSAPRSLPASAIDRTGSWAARQGGIIYPFIVLFIVLAIWKGSIFYRRPTCSTSSTSSPRR